MLFRENTNYELKVVNFQDVQGSYEATNLPSESLWYRI